MEGAHVETSFFHRGTHEDFMRPLRQPARWSKQLIPGARYRAHAEACAGRVEVDALDGRPNL